MWFCLILFANCLVFCLNFLIIIVDFSFISALKWTFFFCLDFYIISETFAILILFSKYLFASFYIPYLAVFDVANLFSIYALRLKIDLTLDKSFKILIGEAEAAAIRL